MWTDIWNFVTTERVKTVAAIVQAFGFIVAAWLAYSLSKRLEDHKFEMKLKEIMHANTHKRRLETLENIAGLMGKLIFEMSAMVPSLGTLKEQSPQRSDETYEDFEERVFRESQKDFHKAVLDMFFTVESGLLYINNDLLHKLYQFEEHAADVIGKYHNGKKEKHPDDPLFRSRLSEEAMTGYRNVRKERDEIIPLLRKLIQENPSPVPALPRRWFSFFRKK
jgi:hypothetical protein